MSEDGALGRNKEFQAIASLVAKSQDQHTCVCWVDVLPSFWACVVSDID